MSLFNINSKRIPTMSMDVFCTTLVDKNGPRDPDGSAEIREIEHWKDRSLLEHEFPVARVRHSGSHFWIRIERSGQQRSEWRLTFKIIKKIIPARDEIRIMNDHIASISIHKTKKEPVVLARLQYDDHPPLLWQFGLLLRTIIDNSEYYQLWAEQCYWMCSTIMTVLEDVFPEGRLIPYLGQSLGGTYGGIPVPQSIKTRDDVREGFKQALQRFGYVANTSQRAISPAPLPDKDVIPLQDNADVLQNRAEPVLPAPSNLEPTILKGTATFTNTATVDLVPSSTTTLQADISQGGCNEHATNISVTEPPRQHPSFSHHAPPTVKPPPPSYLTHLHRAPAHWNAGKRSHSTGCLEGTRITLLQQIMDWIQSHDPTSPRIYWINGLAGIGKSTVAHTVAEECHRLRILGASFFFDRQHAECSDSLLFFITIALQLAELGADFRELIVQAIESDRNPSDAAIKTQLHDFIIEPLKKLTNPPDVIVIVVDALDECRDEKNVPIIIQLLADELPRLPWSLKFLITSRPEHHIYSKFNSRFLTNRSQAIVLHNIEKSIVQSDIESYLRERLTQIGDLDQPMEKDVFQTIVDRAAGLFIFAATVVKYIEEDPEDAESWNWRYSRSYSYASPAHGYRHSSRITDCKRNVTPILPQHGHLGRPYRYSCI
jgi:hypothetical protein